MMIQADGTDLGTMNELNSKVSFTFESDKFSLYALVYEDVKTVDTGDTTNTATLLMIMGRLL